MEGRILLIIACDFDGTLATDSYPSIGRPNTRMIRLLQEAKRKGTYLILWTCRQGAYLDEAVQACREWGLEFDAVNRNIPEVENNWGGKENCGPKVFAHMYIDDRAVNVLDFDELLL